MTEIIALTLFIILGISTLLFLRFRDSRYLKKMTRETISEELREEIESERSGAIIRRGKFERALKKAGGKPE